MSTNAADVALIEDLRGVRMRVRDDTGVVFPDDRGVPMGPYCN